MRIVQLGPEHEAALREFLDEFAARGETEIHGFFGRPEWTHAETVAAFARWSHGSPPAGWVPSTTSFLVDAGRVLGVANYRHWLTPHLLEHGGHVGYSVRPSERGRGHGARLLRDAIRRARRFGLERVLVTCDAGNIASARVIEKCAGVFDSEAPTDGEPIRRYWIDLRARVPSEGKTRTQRLR
jgi:predicted acetyltransferase